MFLVVEIRKYIRYQPAIVVGPSHGSSVERKKGTNATYPLGYQHQYV